MSLQERRRECWDGTWWLGRCWRWAGRYCAVALALSGCDDNNFQSLNEQSKTAWSEVLNQYQRQALDTARCAPRTLT